MPVYNYEAVDQRGHTLKGMMPALDESNLEQKLKTHGLWLTDAGLERPKAAADTAGNGKSGGLVRAGRASRRDLIDFCTLMTFQIRVGVTLVKALEVARQDCTDVVFQSVLGGLQSRLESGDHFYEALAHYPGAFSTNFVSVIRAGEMSSKLPETFDDLREHLEWTEQIIADVRQATIYPAIVMTVIAAFTLLLFTFVIPRFSHLLSSLHVQQPLLTQIVFALGDAAQSTWWISLPLLLVLVLGVVFGRRMSPRIALLLDHLKLRVPIFGSLNHMLALSRFAHNLAILYRSGVPILQALEYCKRGLIGNAVVERAVAAVGDAVNTGSTISEAMHRQPIFSAMLLRMVTMGETTGSLDTALDNVADYYNAVIPRRIKKIFSIMEPLLMLVLIGIVGCVALAIYMPIISLMGAIR